MATHDTAEQNQILPMHNLTIESPYHMKLRNVFLLALVVLWPVLHADNVVHREHTINEYTTKARKVVLTYSEDELKVNYDKFKASGHPAITEDEARAKAQKEMDGMLAGEKWKVLGGIGVEKYAGVPMYPFNCMHLGSKGESTYECVSVLVLLDGTVIAPKLIDQSSGAFCRPQQFGQLQCQPITSWRWGPPDASGRGCSARGKTRGPITP